MRTLLTNDTRTVDKDEDWLSQDKVGDKMEIVHADSVFGSFCVIRTS